MPANLTPQYLQAEAAYKEAKTIEEKIEALQKMLAVIPRHKGTEKLQADIKRRLAACRENKERQKKREGGYNPFFVERQGAGQVVFAGFPNSGKSSLAAKLTRAKVKVAEFPFTTTLPVAGMMRYEDIAIQLVDTPPIISEAIPPGLTGIMRESDALLIVVDTPSEACLEELAQLFSLLEEKALINLEKKQKRAREKPFVVAASKMDLKKGKAHLELLKEFWPHIPIIPVSTSGLNLGLLKKNIFSLLRVIRVHSKPPGKPPQLERPFTMKKGGTVMDFAACIHRDFPGKLSTARVWGSVRFEGQPVSRNYVLADKDIVELNF